MVKPGKPGKPAVEMAKLGETATKKPKQQKVSLDEFKKRNIGNWSDREINLATKAFNLSLIHI